MSLVSHGSRFTASCSLSACKVQWGPVVQGLLFPLTHKLCKLREVTSTWELGFFICKAKGWMNSRAPSSSSFYDSPDPNFRRTQISARPPPVSLHPINPPLKAP